MVTHDMAEAGFFGDHVVLLSEGRIVQRGTLEEMIRAPAEPFVNQFIQAQRTPQTETPR
jgi:osmoprotectant transport system ATP-binding protein